MCRLPDNAFRLAASQKAVDQYEVTTRCSFSVIPRFRLRNTQL